MKSFAFIVSLIMILLTLFQNLHSQTGWDITHIGNELPVNKIYFIDENTGWAASSGGYTFVSGGNFFRTTNGGSNWTLILHNSVSNHSFHFINSAIGWMVGGYWDDMGRRRRFIFKSINSGLNWDTLYQDSVLGVLSSINFFNENNGLVAGYLNTQASIMRTFDSGHNWNHYNIPNIQYFKNIYFFNIDTGFALAYPDGKFLKTTNSGENWILQSEPGNSASSFFFSNLNTGWVVGNNGLVLKTDNSGINWITQNSGINYEIKSAFFISPDTGWCSGENGIIIHTTNGGTNWISQTSNTTFNLNSIFFINGTTGWAAGGFQMITGNSIILKTTTGGLIPVKSFGEEVPQKYSLYQNYPNPFNPVTNIRYNVPKSGLYLKLVIFDVLGREITTLVSESNVKPGTYETVWDASNYSSGVYFYKLLTDGFSETRKMVLIK